MRRDAVERLPLAIISRTVGEVEELVKTLGGAKAGRLASGGDVSDECSIKDACRRIHERFGKLDLLVANAGVDGTWSSLVVVSSINGNRVFSSLGACAYSTSKAAQVVFMKMIAPELAVKGIRINAVCPGSIPRSTITFANAIRRV